MIENDGISEWWVEPEKTTNVLKECKEHLKIGRDRNEKERREGRRKSKGVTSSKMRLKSKRPKQEEEGGAGVEGEFFGVLPHSEWSRVPESRLSVYFRRHGPLHYPYHLSYVLCISHLSYNARTRRHVCRTQWINAVASRRRHSVLEYSADTNVCPRNSL